MENITTFATQFFEKLQEKDKNPPEKENFETNQKTKTETFHFGQKIQSVSFKKDETKSFRKSQPVENFRPVNEVKVFPLKKLSNLKDLKISNEKIKKRISYAIENSTVSDFDLVGLIFIDGLTKDDVAVLKPNNFGLIDLDLQIFGLDFSFLDFEKNKFSLFPGQVVFLKGEVKNQIFYANQIFTDFFKKPERPKIPIENSKVKKRTKILTVTGPFVPRSSFDYRPIFEELCLFLNMNNVDVCLLGGPLIDINNGVLLESFQTIGEAYKYVFKILSENLLKKTKTKTFYLPNLHEAFLAADSFFFPQFVEKISSFFNTAENFHLLESNPAFLRFCDGADFVVTASDLLLGLAQSLFTTDVEKSKIEISVRMLTEQNFLYPLLTKKSIDGINFDHNYKLEMHTKDFSPKVIVSSSSQLSAQFKTGKDDIFFVNNGVCCKNSKGGNFACLEVIDGQINAIEIFSVSHNAEV